MATTITLGELSELVNGTLRGDPNIQIHSAAPLHLAQVGDLTWLTDKRLLEDLARCQASAALVGPGLDTGELAVVVCEDPDLALAVTLQAFAPPKPHPPVGVDAQASVDDSVQLGQEVAIGPSAVLQADVRVGRGTIIYAGVFVGQGSTIGEDCVLWPNAVVRERTVIGNRVVIHCNATIGADGFGYHWHDGQFRRIPHIGRVRIEDDAEIGANACIDRAKTNETVIGAGTKVDNLVQIAHNVRIGAHCCLVAQAGIAGSTTLGQRVMLAGKVGVKDHVRIGDGVQAAACSCIAGNIPDGQIVLGIPAEPKEQFFREHSALRRLPHTARQVRDLIKRVERLEAANNQEHG